MTARRRIPAISKTRKPKIIRLAVPNLSNDKRYRSGRGIGDGLAELLAQRGKEIVDLGVDDPEIFEVIGLFQEGFGPDLLSDMAVSILKVKFFAYTERIATDLKLAPTKSFRLKGKEWKLPVHPDGKTALILVPSEVLTPLRDVAPQSWPVEEALWFPGPSELP